MGLLAPFQTFLWPRLKNAFIGFYKKRTAGFPQGQVIEAPFTRAGAGRKVIDAAGNLVDAAANLPAWTFPIGGSSAGCPYLSFLPSVENLLTYSEEFDNAAWTKSGTSVTANDTTSPDGTTNADLITRDGTTENDRVRQTKTVANSTVHTLSVFVKNNDVPVNTDGTYIAFRISGGTLFRGGFIWRADGSIQANDSASDNSGTFTANVTDMQFNGWHHIGITFTTDGTSGDVEFDVQRNTTTETTSIFIWGAMLKEGSYISPLDYIPTTSTAVTRSADSLPAFDTVSNGMLTDSVGSVMLQVTAQEFARISSTVNFQIGTSGNRILYYNSATSATRPTFFVQTSSGSDQVDAPLDTNRIVFTYDGTNSKVYINGFLALTQAGALDLSGNSNLLINGTGRDVNFKMLNFAPTALTASEAEAASAWPSASLLISDLGYTLA